MKRDPKPTAARARSGPRRAAPEAAADIDRVVDRYVTEVIMEEDPHDPESMYWWWPRAAWVDPNSLIVDGENGNLYRVEFTTNDRQEVTFKDPVETLEEFNDLAPSAKAKVLAATHEEARPRSAMRVFASREEVPGLPKREPEAGVGDGANNVGMDRDQLCEALGLPTDATDEQVDAATAARKAELAEETPEQPETPETPETPEEPETPETPEVPAEAAQLPEGMIAVPKEAWETVQAGAQQGAAVATANEAKRRDETIVAACAKGKIAPSAKQSMENLHERDPDAFYNLLTASVAEGGLAEGLVPVSAHGASKPGSPAEASAESVSNEEMVRLFGQGYAREDAKVSA